MPSRSLVAQAAPGGNTVWPQCGEGLTASVTFPPPASCECRQYLRGSATSHGCPLGRAVSTELCACSSHRHPPSRPTGFGTGPVLSFPHDLHTSPLASRLRLLLVFAPFPLLWLSGANVPIFPPCLPWTPSSFPDSGFTKAWPRGISHGRPNSGRIHLAVLITS